MVTRGDANPAVVRSVTTALVHARGRCHRVRSRVVTLGRPWVRPTGGSAATARASTTFRRARATPARRASPSGRYGQASISTTSPSNRGTARSACGRACHLARMGGQIAARCSRRSVSPLEGTRPPSHRVRRIRHGSSTAISRCRHRARLFSPIPRRSPCRRTFRSDLARHLSLRPGSRVRSMSLPPARRRHPSSQQTMRTRSASSSTRRSNDHIGGRCWTSRLPGRSDCVVRVPPRTRHPATSVEPRCRATTSRSTIGSVELDRRPGRMPTWRGGHTVVALQSHAMRRRNGMHARRRMAGSRAVGSPSRPASESLAVGPGRPIDRRGCSPLSDRRAMRAVDRIGIVRREPICTRIATIVQSANTTS